MKRWQCLDVEIEGLRYEESEGVFVSVAMKISLSTGEVLSVEDLGDCPEDEQFTNFMAEQGLKYLREQGKLDFLEGEEW